nr:putative receptor protein kinase ZmPK1 [Tanacetum cinerariifolium]
PYTDYYGFDLNFSSPISFEACRDICLKDCHCEAFSYRLTGDGVCFAKSALFNGYHYPHILGTMYFKVPVGMESQKYASILTGGNRARWLRSCVQRVLEYERVVAVKRLGNVSEGGEFWEEVSTIGKDEESELMRLVRVTKKEIEEEKELWIEDVIDPRFKDERNERLAISVGILLLSLFTEMSSDSRLSSFPIDGGIGPVSALWDRFK